MNFRDRLVNYFKASFPAVAIQTTEEARALADVFDAAKKLNRRVITWSAIEGARVVVPDVKPFDQTEDLLSACKLRDKETVFVLRDPHTWPFDRDPVLARGFRDFISAAPANGSTVVVLAHEFRPHPTVERLVTVLDYSLPSKEDLTRIAEGIAESAEDSSLAATEEVLRALGGLSTSESENALALSFVETGRFDPAVIYREKIQAVRRGGLLDLVEADPRGLASVGGLDALKAWVERRKNAWSPEAEKFGLPAPKGVLLVGVPGTGKSLSAKAIGTALGVPTVKLDVGALFNSLVGESEARTRDALKLAEAMAPCVLWVDEIDKGLAGAGGGGSGDSGVTKRVFGTIISWMQERRRPVFIVATANDVSHLPPEFLRKGRFDEIFAVDLPSDSERAAIFGIHLAKRNRNPKKFDLARAVAVTANFTGSEIEAVLDEALFAAFHAGRELKAEDLVEAAERTVPLATTAKDQIEAIREWAQSRARFASEKETNAAEISSRRKLGGKA